MVAKPLVLAYEFSRDLAALRSSPAVSVSATFVKRKTPATRGVFYREGAVLAHHRNGDSLLRSTVAPRSRLRGVHLPHAFGPITGVHLGMWCIESEPSLCFCRTDDV
ncbi:protein of unknown function (plasmid) [Caballeronia sp. S22]